MITALNMTVKLKQDPESLHKLQQLKAIFADRIQPEIDRALRKSGIVHFVRVLVIDDKYLQVLTEFDGDPEEYTEFFRRELRTSSADLRAGRRRAAVGRAQRSGRFFQASQHMNVKALGRSTDGREARAGCSAISASPSASREALREGAAAAAPASGEAPAGGGAMPRRSMPRRRLHRRGRRLHRGRRRHARRILTRSGGASRSPAAQFAGERR